MTIFKSKNHDISGQSMVMMVVMLSVAALGAASLATFLIVSGFRNISSARQSMDAIFAADAGIECVLFREFGHADYSVVSSVCPSGEGISKSLDNLSSFVFRSRGGARGCDEWSASGFDSSRRTNRVLNICFTKR